jgi:hypothetical protein
MMKGFDRLPVHRAGPFLTCFRHFRVVEPHRMTGTDETDEYRYLWDGSEDGWVVITSGLGLGSIFNTETRMALLIEDNALYARVIELMRRHRCPFLDHFPQ